MRVDDAWTAGPRARRPRHERRSRLPRRRRRRRPTPAKKPPMPCSRTRRRPEASIPTASGAGLDSVDVLRGATIAGMIVVNDPGTWSSVYPPLLHAEWNGWTYTDTIFPFFLFLVGVSMALSLGRRRAGGRGSGRAVRPPRLARGRARRPRSCAERSRALSPSTAARPVSRGAAAHRPLRPRSAEPYSSPAASAARRSPPRSSSPATRWLLGTAPARSRDQRRRSARPARLRRPHVEAGLGSGGPALDSPRDRDDAPRRDRGRARADARAAPPRRRRARLRRSRRRSRPDCSGAASFRSTRACGRRPTRSDVGPRRRRARPGDRRSSTSWAGSAGRRRSSGSDATRSPPLRSRSSERSR